MISLDERCVLSSLHTEKRLIADDRVAIVVWSLVTRILLQCRFSTNTGQAYGRHTGSVVLARNGKKQKLPPLSVASFAWNPLKAHLNLPRKFSYKNRFGTSFVMQCICHEVEFE